MMMGNCGLGMMVFVGLGAMLGLALLMSLIVLTWVLIGRLRHGSPPPAPR